MSLPEGFLWLKPRFFRGLIWFDVVILSPIFMVINDDWWLHWLDDGWLNDYHWFSVDKLPPCGA